MSQSSAGPTRVLVFVDSLEVLRLVKRLSAGASACGEEITVVASRLSVFLTARRLRIRCVLAARADRASLDADGYDPHNYEVRVGYITDAQGIALYRSLFAAGEKQIRSSREDFSLILAWNGALISSQVASSISKTFGIPLLFMEITNFSGRMLFDPEGSARDALVAKHPEVMDRYQVDLDGFKTWKQDFIAARRRTNTVRQAAGFIKPNLGFAIDVLGPLLFGTAAPFSVGPLHRIRNIVANKLYRQKLDRKSVDELPDGPYVFLPLQVSTDTNLVVRSEIDNEQAIRIAQAEATGRGARLVVKLHPAERDGGFLRRLDGLLEAEFRDVVLTRANTVTCIEKSDCVVTINSTVGLEARMLGKEVKILQPTIYEKWTERQLAAFVFHYSVPFDMYRDTDASPAQWRDIKARRPSAM